MIILHLHNPAFVLKVTDSNVIPTAVCSLHPARESTFVQEQEGALQASVHTT